MSRRFQRTSGTVTIATPFVPFAESMIGKLCANATTVGLTFADGEGNAKSRAGVAPRVTWR